MPHSSSYYLLHTEAKMNATQSLQLFQHCGCSHLHLCKHSTSRLHTFHGLSLFHRSLKCLVLLFSGLSPGYFRCHTSSHSDTAAHCQTKQLLTLSTEHMAPGDKVVFVDRILSQDSSSRSQQNRLAPEDLQSPL